MAPRQPTKKQDGKLGTVDLAPGLYLVSTPIGNLRDITLRALEVLGQADLVICEDTRVSGKLLSAYEIKAEMLPYNDHNADKQRGKILESLAQGGRAALISDAGTPLVSDPGFKLVRDCIDLGLPVTSVPGANAVLSALQLSGLPSDKFSFIGFLPPKEAARRNLLEEWKEVPGSLVVYETAPRLLSALRDIEKILGGRNVAVVREITKMYEEARRGTVSDLILHYEEKGAPKGEIVLVIGPAAKQEYSEKELLDLLCRALESMSTKEAAAAVAAQTGVSRKRLYDMALGVSGGKG